MKKLCINLLGLFIPLMMIAQTTSINGHVSDAVDGEPLVGATVSVKGTMLSVATDANGNFKISLVPQWAEKLVVSYIGYTTREIDIDDIVDIKMYRNAEVLDEVVVAIPYGTVKKNSFTGSVGLIEGAAIERSQVSNISKALQGNVAGLQSFSSTGQPGSEATVIIRGVGSVNASSAPLYVVDGVPYDGNLSSINSSDIASVSVLKDAAAASLYGSRAANGVIMITTRQGNRNAKPSIEVAMKYGFSDRARPDYRQLDTNQYFELYWEALRNFRLDQGDDATKAAEYASNNLVGRLGINPYGTDHPNPVGTDGKLFAGASPLWNDNWEEALSQNAHYTDLNFRVSGGSSNSSYYISAGYLDDRGAYIESGFKRYNVRTNVVSDLYPWLQVGANIALTNSVQDYPKQDDSAISNIVLFGRNMPSFYPIYQRDLTTGEYLLDEQGKHIWDYGYYRVSSYAKYNLVASQPHDLNRIKRDAATVMGHLLITPVKDLTYKMTLNVDYNNRNDHYYTNPAYGPGAQTGGGVSKSNIRSTAMTWNNVINYLFTLKDIHNFRLMAGHEFYHYTTTNYGGSRSGVIMDGFYEPDAAATLSSFYGNSDAYKLLSFFGSAEYNYDRRYFVSGSVRADGSSRFHPDHRWGTFWSTGASWRVSRENFMEWARPTLDNLSLRASYGAQGNDKVGYYAYQALYDIYNNLGQSGLIGSRLATPSLSWETNYNFNIGLDFSVINSRLRGSLEYFVRRSKDLLFNKDLVPSSGFSSTTQNIGSLRNYGWELVLEAAPVQSHSWAWTLRFNATTYKNKITSLPSPEMWSGAKKWVEGGSLYDWWMIEWAGINPDNGNPQWYRYNENGEKYTTDDFSSCTTADKVKIGNSLPVLTGGFGSDVRWRDLSLLFLISYSIGGKLYNSDKVSLLGHSSTGSGWSADMLDRWTPDNRDTDIPRLTTQAYSSWTNQSSRHLVDRSYARLKNVTLSYSLPHRLLSKTNQVFKDARLFVQAENLFTLCGQQGLDPEQTVGGTTYYRYPAMKTVSIGFNVKL